MDKIGDFLTRIRNAQQRSSKEIVTDHSILLEEIAKVLKETKFIEDYDVLLNKGESHKKLFVKYVKAIAIGIPLWYVVSILVMFSPEFAKVLAITGKVTAGQALMYCYIGLAIGDLGSGYLSQIMKSRKKAFFIFQPKKDGMHG